MVLIILGVLILIISFSITRVPNTERPVRIGRYIGIVLILLGIITSSLVQIDAGHVGVKKLFGNIHNDILTSGLHLVNPLYEVNEMDIKTQNYTMSGVHDEGQKMGDDAVRALTADGLEVVIDVTILYRLAPSDA
ncbi:MAG: prohibitin family protein, partial [Flavisolibacter sp.]|nr:prohibitin family protein [Flavisolibacter sp.]